LSNTDSGDLEALFEAVFAYDSHVRPTVGDLLGLPNWLSRPRYSVVGRLAHEVEAPALRMIEDRRLKGAQNDVMAAICNPQAGRAPNAKSIRDQAMSLIMASHLTTHAALLWTFYLIAMHPRERQRLESEIDDVLQGRRPNHDDVARLRFTWQVIQEAMRLYPPVSIIPRQAIEADRIGEHDVPKGATIVISPWLTHRNPNLWDFPSRFVPDRFSEDAAAKRPRYVYMPFGAGPHICVGAHFAMIETVLTVASVIQKWRLDLAPEAVVEPVALISLRPRDGMPLVFRRRRPGD
jgi:cytochrome P450